MEKTDDEASLRSPTISDWDKPFTDEELEAIEAAFQSAASTSSIKNRGPPHSNDVDCRQRTRRRLPDSIFLQIHDNRSRKFSDGGSSSPQKYDSFSLLPCPSNRVFREATVKMRYPSMTFGGEIVYSRSFDEVEDSASQILNLVESRKQDGQVVLGVDIEWRPTFNRGIPPGKAAVLQICGNMTHCYVMHIIHSGIPQKLRDLLEDSSSLKVGVGIGNDAVKIFQDHSVSVGSLEDLSSLANQKLDGRPRQWSLSSLVEMLTCKQLLKPNKIRLGNWETDVLSKAQLQYAATDAFASWYLYQVLKSFPDKPDG
ncbi:hypothetical protein Ancab_014031 [Ancistrocladus abbreviatus]